MRTTEPLPYDVEPQPGGIGDNRPPDEADPLRDRLTDTHGAMIGSAQRLMGDFADRVPDTIFSDAENERASDYIKELTGCVKAMEAARVSEKEPFLKAGRTVDGLFMKVGKDLEQVKKAVSKIKTIYERQKADEERRVREEAERQARAEAEQARQRAEAADRAAMKAQEGIEEALDSAIEAEKKAEQAEKDVVQIARDAGATAADLSRTRSAKGSVSSLRTFWDYRGFDPAAIDLEPLRYHLPAGAIEKAVRSFVKAGGRELDGVEIFENTESVTR